MSIPATRAPFVLDIPGTWNARDVGGRATPRGSDRPLATGVLLRTASLAKVTDTGLAALGDLDVKLVCDLRGETEVARDGADRVPDTTRVVRRAMDPSPGVDLGPAGDSGDPAAMIAHLMGAPDRSATARRLMANIYRSFVTDSSIRAQVAQTLADIASSPGTVIVHCSAGKDRTGWIVDLVQYVCGVEEGDRMAEYLASAHGASTLAQAIPPIPGLDPEALAPLLTVTEDYLNAGWKAATAHFGSMDAYLAECGVTDAIRERIGERLVR